MSDPSHILKYYNRHNVLFKTKFLFVTNLGAGIPVMFSYDNVLFSVISGLIWRELLMLYDFYPSTRSSIIIQYKNYD
jgi:hypothetical protein